MNRRTPRSELHNQWKINSTQILPKTWPAIILPSSPATAARAFLSLTYWTKAKPLWTEQPTILPYFEKIASTSDFLTTRVLRFPMNTREFMERGSVLLVTLLAIVFDDKVPHKAEKCSWRLKKSPRMGKGEEIRFWISYPWILRGEADCCSRSATRWQLLSLHLFTKKSNNIF